jgi:hypothetical protein
MKTQVRLPAALAALHNFIHNNDPKDIEDFEDDEDEDEDRRDLQWGEHGDLADGIPRRAEKRWADDMRDKITRDMWIDYQRELRE